MKHNSRCLRSDNKKISWTGSPIKTNKCSPNVKYSLRHKIEVEKCYNAANIGSISIRVGDFVNVGLQMFIFMKAECSNATNKYVAKVQWFSKRNDIPVQIEKLNKHYLYKSNEIFMLSTSDNCTIKLTDVTSKCDVIILGLHDHNKILTPTKRNKLYLCRFKIIDTDGSQTLEPVLCPLVSIPSRLNSNDFVINEILNNSLKNGLSYTQEELIDVKAKNNTPNSTTGVLLKLRDASPEIPLTGSILKFTSKSPCNLHKTCSELNASTPRVLLNKCNGRKNSKYWTSQLLSPKKYTSNISYCTYQKCLKEEEISKILEETMDDSEENPPSAFFEMHDYSPNFDKKFKALDVKDSSLFNNSGRKDCSNSMKNITLQGKLMISNRKSKCIESYEASSPSKFRIFDCEQLETSIDTAESNKSVNSSHSKSTSLNSKNLSKQNCESNQRNYRYNIRRKLSMSDTQGQCLGITKKQLHLSNLLADITCRENEFKTIYKFVQNKLQNNCSGCMYVSGVPGTGKTVTLKKVLQKLKKEKALPVFNLVEINGMKLSEPHQLYVKWWQLLTGQKLSKFKSFSCLQTKFTKTSQNNPCVLIIDEFDLLWTPKQDVLYHVLDWPSYPLANLVVVAVANTMDLPERLLAARVASRLGLTRLLFQPYTYQQLQKIALSRFSNNDAFNSDALQLIARKVAALSGDVRCVLEICRRAIDIAGQNIQVTIDHVEKALEEKLGQPVIAAICASSILEQMLLKVIAQELSNNKHDYINLADIVMPLQMLCQFEGCPVPTVTEILSACNHLAVFHLIITELKHQDVRMKVQLNITSDDVYFALSRSKA